MNKLREILFSINHRATKEQGVRVSRTLSGGLIVTVMVHEGATWLALSRNNSVPSSIEVETVLRHFPYTPPPFSARYEKGYNVVMSWKTPTEGQFVNLPHLSEKGNTLVKQKKPSVAFQMSLFDIQKAPESQGLFANNGG